MKGNDTQTFTSLRLSHARSLQDISELKKLRETVGKSIRDACLLVDGHGWDYTEHCEKLKKTRERFSRFERKLSNATSSSVENGNISNRRAGSLYSYSSGDDSCSVPSSRRRCSRPSSAMIKARSTLSDDGGKSRQRYSYCSNIQSSPSAYSCSPRSQRSQTFKQIVVPIYEDSFDSGVSVQATSPRTMGSTSTVENSNFDHYRTDKRSTYHPSTKSYSSKGSIYDSDTSSAMSFPESRRTTEMNYRKPSNNNLRQSYLSQPWRSTPNLLGEEPSWAVRPRNKSLLDENSRRSSSVSKRDTALKASEWKSLPNLGSKSQKSGDGAKKARKKKGLVHLFRRITKSGEYVLKNDSKEKAKSKRKQALSKGEEISHPYSASPLGRTVEVIGKDSVFHRVEIKLPRNGLYGFYVQRGYKTSKKGIFIGSFVNPQMKKLFAGVIREGDEIVEINSYKVDSISFEKVLDILQETSLLNLLILPCERRKR